eukprot:GHVR01004357.1.p1 GENE.GHVR01004357.1~~GHVR01004357.1.p1  ORF type:complete len:145 (+),score=108.12 GHVR01004357.1:61-435(+)
MFNKPYINNNNKIETQTDTHTHTHTNIINISGCSRSKITLKASELEALLVGSVLGRAVKDIETINIKNHQSMWRAAREAYRRVVCASGKISFDAIDPYPSHSHWLNNMADTGLLYTHTHKDTHT